MEITDCIVDRLVDQLVSHIVDKQLGQLIDQRVDRLVEEFIFLTNTHQHRQPENHQKPELRSFQTLTRQIVCEWKSPIAGWID